MEDVSNAKDKYNTFKLWKEYYPNSNATALIGISRLKE
jgi:hypothetical protein